jgi:hypothetical protein
MVLTMFLAQTILRQNAQRPRKPRREADRIYGKKADLARLLAPCPDRRITSPADADFPAPGSHWPTDPATTSQPAASEAQAQ